MIGVMYNLNLFFSFGGIETQEPPPENTPLVLYAIYACCTLFNNHLKFDSIIISYFHQEFIMLYNIMSTILYYISDHI